MLHLQASVHLDEVVLTRGGVKKELDRASILVAGGLGEADCVSQNCLADGLVQRDGRRDLDNLLVTSLHRAVTLKEVHNVALGVGKDLHLNVAGLGHVLLHKEVAVAKGSKRLRVCSGEARFQVVFGVDDAHASSSAAVGGLEHERVGEERLRFHEIANLLHRRQRCLGAGEQGDISLLGKRASGDLVTHQGNRLGARTDKGNASVSDRLGKLGRFGQKAVAGVNGVTPIFLGNANDVRNVQIDSKRVVRGGTKLIGFVSLVAVGRRAVKGRVHGDRPKICFSASPQQANRNFSAICCQNLGN
mmetsp:Transcript_13549/g.42648  ORF Transcript_13549/g.42648 Transcript_13549/m.42648 type:complete len:303 (-) Transcript_13549:34-942(-)